MYILRKHKEESFAKLDNPTNADLNNVIQLFLERYEDQLEGSRVQVAFLNDEQDPLQSSVSETQQFARTGAEKANVVERETADEFADLLQDAFFGKENGLLEASSDGIVEIVVNFKACGKGA